MWKNVFFWLWKVQKGTSSLHMEMERPSNQVVWGEAKFVVTSLCWNVEETNADIIMTYPFIKEVERMTGYQNF
jgi:hypothetical protein